MKLELLGDLPDAEIQPPDNVLFVCKLHPVTTEEDLELIFSRFGIIKACDIIRDHKTNDSLCYGFIEYENKESAEEAYFKMNKVLIDDRRIHVDFSQSVAKVDWIRAGGWRNYFKNKARNLNFKPEVPGGGNKRQREYEYSLKQSKVDEYSMLFDETSEDTNKSKRQSKKQKVTPAHNNDRHVPSVSSHHDKVKDRGTQRHRDRESDKDRRERGRDGEDKDRERDKGKNRKRHIDPVK